MQNVCITLACSRNLDNGKSIQHFFRLGSWVSKQRWQYKKFIKGKSSHITQDRIDSLNDIGFIWDFYQDAFDFRLSQLVEYKVANGDCNIPRVYNDNLE